MHTPPLTPDWVPLRRCQQVERWHRDRHGPIAGSSDFSHTSTGTKSSLLGLQQVSSLMAAELFFHKMIFDGRVSAPATRVIIYVYILISADPCLGLGWGGVWDHRTCGTCIVTAIANTFQKQLLVCVCALPNFKGCKKEAAAPTTEPSRRPARQLSQLHAPGNASNPSAFPSRLSQLHAPERQLSQLGPRHCMTLPQAFPGQL